MLNFIIFLHSVIFVTFAKIEKKIVSSFYKDPFGLGSVFAKEASDIVIAENDLSNLVRGVEEARLLFDNLKKTVAYTLSHLLPELLPILLSFVFGFPLGLNSLQVSEGRF